MLILFLLLMFAAVLFVFAVQGRRGHSGLTQLRGWYYAHRGLHSPGVPENSLAAFQAAKDAGYGVELDVHLMRDGTLAVIHDSSLLRAAGADVRIEDLSKEDLSSYRLFGTQERIPLLADVLALFAGKVPLIIELKALPETRDALCEAVCAMLDTYQGVYCLESFDPKCVAWLCKNRPEIVRGQLVENYLKVPSAIPWLARFAATHQMFNFLTKPDFVAYRFQDRKTVSNRLVRDLWGIQGVSWTLDTQQDFDTALAEGWIPIFENLHP